MEKIAARLGLRLEWRELAFADLLSVLERGEVDVVIAGLYITPEREERVDMSQPYLRTGLALVVQSENIHIRSLEDLAGQVVGVKEGATGDQLATYLRTEGGIPLQVRRYTDTPDSLADLDAGRLDAVFNDYINTLEYAKHHPGVRVQGDIFSPAGLGIAVQSGDWELLALVNAALDVFEQDGTLEALWQKWIALRVQP
jgi:polar amino acid transport system substrate-binding protein